MASFSCFIMLFSTSVWTWAPFETIWLDIKLDKHYANYVKGLSTSLYDYLVKGANCFFLPLIVWCETSFEIYFLHSHSCVGYLFDCSCLNFSLVWISSSLRKIRPSRHPTYAGASATSGASAGVFKRMTPVKCIWCKNNKTGTFNEKLCHCLKLFSLSC